MTVRTQKTKILDHVVLMISINVIELKRKYCTIPKRFKIAKFATICSSCYKESFSS